MKNEERFKSLNCCLLCIGGPDQIEENHYHGETNEVHKLGLDLYRGHKIHAEALDP